MSAYCCRYWFVGEQADKTFRYELTIGEQGDFANFAEWRGDYNDLDRLTRLKDAKGNTVIADNNYQYNSANQITQNIDQSGTHAYGYDSLDRLTSATYTGTAAESYSYDSVGNRTNSQRSSTYSYQPFNRLTGTSTAGYLYDNNGNMTTKTEGAGTTHLAWDFENRLTQVVTPAAGSVSYKYDALGRRIQSAPSTGASTNFTYDGQDVAQDKTSAGTITEYLNGPGIDNKIRQKTGTTFYYFAKDHLGSTTALTDSKGALAERETYDAYGNSAGSAKTRYGFTGRERDTVTGLLHYRARWYDPQLGRFISEDPIGLAGGINPFAYVRNNPARFTDPSGLCPQNPVLSQKGPCDTSTAAVKSAAQQIANTIAGASVGTQGGQPIINFQGNYDQTLKQLQQAGYYSGILALNPIDHPGGEEFRTWGSPGFHFKVVYPLRKAVPVAPNSPEFKPVTVDKPAIATDLHIDCHNPVGAGPGETLRHGADFIRDHTPWWIPIIIP